LLTLAESPPLPFLTRPLASIIDKKLERYTRTNCSESIYSGGQSQSVLVTTVGAGAGAIDEELGAGDG